MPALNRAPANRELERLIKVFLKAETDIINEIGRLRSLGNADYHAVVALERVQAILRGLENDCWQYVPKMIEREFYVRAPEERRIEEPVSKHAAAYANAGALTMEQTAVVERLVMNLMGEITGGTLTARSTLESALTGRREPDLFRRLGLEQAAYMEAAGRGPYRALPGFVEALRREGVTAFVDRAGRRWSLHAYGSMALRTTVRQAENLAVLTADRGQDLYKISSHGTSCPLCAPYEGRVYSKSGTDPDFPPLAAAFGKVDPAGPDDLSNTWLNIHPNCLHVLLPWTPAGRSEEEIQRIKDFSNPEKNPFDRDPRSEAARAAYRQKEQGRRRWLADYRQWEKYRMTLGDRCPRTFDTFLRHKRAGDEKWKLWKLDYGRQRHLMEHPELALPGAATATAADTKFTKYFFCQDNPSGWNKGLAFSSRLGYNISNWEKMRFEILAAATRYPAAFKGENAYGQRYEQLVILRGLKNRPANVLIGWQVNKDGTVHMTTAHMEEVK